VHQKKVSHGNITDGINPSAISTVITDGLSVGNYGIGSNCLPTLCEIPTDIIRRYVFKIYKNNNLLIEKKLNKQIKLD
jgi:hypothetical protein